MAAKMGPVIVGSRVIVNCSVCLPNVMILDMAEGATVSDELRRRGWDVRQGLPVCGECKGKGSQLAESSPVESKPVAKRARRKS